jgi:hypothetical protein
LSTPANLARGGFWPFALGLAACLFVVHPHPAAASGAHQAAKALVAALPLGVWLARRPHAEVPRVVLAYVAMVVAALLVTGLRGHLALASLGAIGAPLFVALGSSVACAVFGAARSHDVRRLHLVLHGATVLLALVALVELHVFDLPWAHERRPQATLANRNFLAHFLAMALPLVLAAPIRGRLQRALHGVGVFAIAHVLLQTRCRAAWVALALAALCALASALTPAFTTGTYPARVSGAHTAAFARLLRWSLRHVATLTAAALGAFSVALPTRLTFRSGVLDSASRLAEVSAGSGAGRLQQWKVAALLWVRAPLSGYGLGEWFGTVTGRPAVRHMIPGAVGTTPNSDLARALVEGGAPLALAMVFMLAWAVRSPATCGKLLAHPSSRLARAARLTCVVLAALTLLDTPLFRVETSLLFGLALGWARSGGHPDSPSAPSTTCVPRWLSLPLLAAATVGALATAWPH